MTAETDDARDQRLIALEIRMAHYERVAEELSDVLVDQSRTIDLLTAQLHRLRERMAEMAASPERSPQDDRPPPHY